MAKNMWCTRCHVNGVGRKRARYKHTVCKPCGDAKAKDERLSWCVAIPYSKGAYQLITNPAELFSTNPKETRV